MSGSMKMDIFTSTQDQKGLPRYFRHVFKILSSIKIGTVEVSLPDGRIFKAEGLKGGSVARINVIDPDCFSRLVRDGDIGFLEAYMDAQWATPDLQCFMDVIFQNFHQLVTSFPGAGLVKMFEKLRHWLNSNSKRQARKNISYHYDLGNKFYGLWLDKTMTYSSALYKTKRENLDVAQTQKYAQMCDEIGIKEGDHILEIGCGWGGFAEYAAGQRGAKVKGLTISQEQHDFAVARIERAGLSQQVEIVMQDYRDESAKYDGIASIEMFEAVGEKYWPVYFNKVNACLKPNAKATLQIITVPEDRFNDYRNSVDFIQKYIFPGGMLPTEAKLKGEIDRVGLEFENIIEFGHSYSTTLRRWFDTFNAKWPDISPMGFDDRFRRMWNVYLTGCASSFEFNRTGLIQITMKKPLS
ncbi:MAG: class I SAM-dependent methyltransferase [Amylibacter sp.]|jgi:cyclopropane-fatty-acyl-phospholipid synthase|tara:strand:- start:687 stop:1919 length:1233 start_codon:yes stop_codon:yes gene_type:complete